GALDLLDAAAEARARGDGDEEGNGPPRPQGRERATAARPFAVRGNRGARATAAVPAHQQRTGGASGGPRRRGGGQDMTAHDRRLTGTVRFGLSSERHPGAPTASSSRRNACIHRVAPLLCPHLSNVVPTYRTHVEPGRRHHDRLEPLHVGPVSTQEARSPSDDIGTQMTERFLVTGAFGCLGAWVVHELVTNGTEAVAFDIGQDDYRIRYLVDEKNLTRVTYCKGDITDAAAIAAAVRDFNVTNVIHLAALQMPFCAASPSLGAAVNVLGTINVFEAVKNSPAIERPIVYSSSVAAYDAIENPE